MKYVGDCVDSLGQISELYKQNGKYYRQNPQARLDVGLAPNETPLTVLSYGAGQDSACILFKIIHDEKFRKKYVSGKFIVVMADTGNEHPETYEYVKYTSKILKRKKIPFYFLTNDKGYHSPDWKDLIHQLRLHNTIIMNVGAKHLCTIRLKIDPIYRFLDEYCALELGWDKKTFVINKIVKGKKQKFTYSSYLKIPMGDRRKKAIKAYALKNGKIRVLIGFAYGEERRAKKSKANLDPVWMQNSVVKSFPLIPEKINRKKAQEIIRKLGYKVPIPSNCMICPFMSKQELLWLYRKYPEQFGEWEELEDNKIQQCKRRGVDDKKNMGALGTKKTLAQNLEFAQKKYGHMTDKELYDYKFSHGANISGGY